MQGSSIIFTDPCPSLVFQQQIGEFLTQNQESATKLIDTILIQLNWAFSEFVGMLQEVITMDTTMLWCLIDYHYSENGNHVP